jgi:ATP-dependent Clp protease ATP-binding subunit ClpA
MTSNVGSKDMADKAGDNVLGFLTPTEEDASQASLRDTAVSAARKKFMPEFLNRLDDIVMFNTLTQDNLKEILDLELYKLSRIILSHSITKVSMVVTPSAKAQLLKEGYDKKYGARHLKRVIEKHVLLPITRTMASKQVNDLDTVIVGFGNGEFRYHVEFNL